MNAGPACCQAGAVGHAGADLTQHFRQIGADRLAFEESRLRSKGTPAWSKSASCEKKFANCRLLTRLPKRKLKNDVPAAWLLAPRTLTGNNPRAVEHRHDFAFAIGDNVPWLQTASGHRFVGEFWHGGISFGGCRVPGQGTRDKGQGDKEC